MFIISTFQPCCVFSLFRVLGALPYAICQKYVEEIVLVTDDEIKSAVSALYEAALVVEPSGAAAFAALVNNRIPDIAGRNVVVILSGGNV